MHSHSLKESAALSARLRPTSDLALSLAKPLINEKGYELHHLAEMMAEFWVQNAGWPRVANPRDLRRRLQGWSAAPLHPASSASGPGAT